MASFDTVNSPLGFQEAYTVTIPPGWQEDWEPFASVDLTGSSGSSAFHCGARPRARCLAAASRGAAARAACHSDMSAQLESARAQWSRIGREYRAAQRSGERCRNSANGTSLNRKCFAGVIAWIISWCRQRQLISLMASSYASQPQSKAS